MFRSSIALTKMKTWQDRFALSTAKWYIDELNRYLKSGKTLLNTKAKALIEKYKDITPIEPNPNQRRMEGVGRGRKKKIPSQPVVKIEVPKMTTRIYYGLQSNNTIIYFETEKEMTAFLQGTQYTGVTFTPIHIERDGITLAKEEA